MKQKILLFGVLLAMTLTGQSATGKDGRHSENYRPSGRSFVCVNGQNRLTRALYTGHADYRVLTGDRPVFAIYKKNDTRYVQLQVNQVPLDKTTRCVAHYQDGMRSYELRHATWGDRAVLRIHMVPCRDAQRVVWRLRATDFKSPLHLDVIASRSEQSAKSPVQKLSQNFSEEQYLVCDGVTLRFEKLTQGENLFDDAEEAQRELSGRVEFNTPDAYINTLGAALVVAADGGRRSGSLADVLGWSDAAVGCFDDYVKNRVKNVSATLPASAKVSIRCQTLLFLDALLWHFQYDADQVYMRKMWPDVKKMLAELKPHFTPFSPALYVTRWAAYYYRANRLAARIAQLMNENPAPYTAEADAVLAVLNGSLWVNDKGHWAECQDMQGLRRVHPSAAVWSIYTPIDCGACSPTQAYWATKYVDREIPHIPVNSQFSTISTSNWMPYSPGANQVVPADVMHTALAYFEAGRSEEGFSLMKANILDQMYYGQSPANFGQFSKYDVACGEQGRDVAECIGISARTLIQGLYGIRPRALFSDCVIHPGFPESWDSASVHTPYLDYSFRRNGSQLVYEVTQRFAKPLKIVLRQNLGLGKFHDVEGTADAHQVIRVDAVQRLPEVEFYSEYAFETDQDAYGLAEPTFERKFSKLSLDAFYNANVTDIFKGQQLPSPPVINDSLFRTLILKDEFLMMGVPFRSPAVGANIIYTSLSEAFPDSVAIPLSASASKAWLLMAGTTSHTQCRIANGMLVARYKDGTSDSLLLINPVNWCPIEQDYYVDQHAFPLASELTPLSVPLRPYRLSLATGKVSRDLSRTLGIEGVTRIIPGGAAQMLCMPLNRKKRLVSLTLRPLSSDVVIGLMGVTLQ